MPEVTIHRPSMARLMSVALGFSLLPLVLSGRSWNQVAACFALYVFLVAFFRRFFIVRVSSRGVKGPRGAVGEVIRLTLGAPDDDDPDAPPEEDDCD